MVNPNTAEEVIKARLEQSHPSRIDPIEESWKQIYGLIPSVLDALARKEFESGVLKSVGSHPDPFGSEPEITEKAAWELTKEIYLISNGQFGILVVDPHEQLGYEIAQVDLEYIVGRYRATITRKHIRGVLNKLGE